MNESAGDALLERDDVAATGSVSLRAAVPLSEPDERIESLSVDGYGVFRDFLPPDAIEALAEDYRARGSSDNRNYRIGLVSDRAVDVVREPIASLVERVRTQLGLRADFDGLHQGYYFDSQLLTFNSWHQDAESHYMLGTHRDYLNFYIPVVKPVSAKTNVQVIPASRIRECAPEAWPFVEDGGGTICHVSADGESTVVFDESGQRVSLPFDIGELADTPALNAGDLLLVRGDTFHRTQDADTARVALSLRLTDPDRPIRLRDLATGSSKKVNLMAGNWTEFGPAFDMLGKSPRGEAPWRAVRSAISAGTDGSRSLGRSAARRLILGEKVRQGTVIDSLRREFSYRTTRRRLGI